MAASMENVDGSSNENQVYEVVKWTKEGAVRRYFINLVKVLDLCELSSDCTNLEKFRKDVKQRIQDADDVLQSFSHFTDIPESTIVFLILNIIRSGILINDEDEVDDPLLNQILSFSYDDIFLQQHLRQLTSDEAVELLRYLHFKLNDSPLSTGENHVLGTNKVLGWIGVLLDSHFSEFSLIRDSEVIHLFHNLEETVSEMMDPLNDMEDLSQMLSTIKLKTALPKTTSYAPYRIEILKI